MPQAERLFDLSPLSAPEGKRCSGCHDVLPLHLFPPDRRYRDGAYHACRTCLRQQSRATKHVHYHLLLSQQGGVCAVCRRPPQDDEKFDIDHDHETDAIRGLLCRRCNVAYGMLGESLEIISSLVAYHLRWQRKQGVDPNLRSWG